MFMTSTSSGGAECEDSEEGRMEEEDLVALMVSHSLQTQDTRKTKSNRAIKDDTENLSVALYSGISQQLLLIRDLQRHGPGSVLNRHLLLHSPFQVPNFFSLPCRLHDVAVSKRGLHLLTINQCSQL